MEIDIKQAKCTELSIDAPIEIFRKENDAVGFNITAYTGETVERWWGDLTIDLTGIESKKRIPIFMNHNPSQIVGFSTDTKTDGSFQVSGLFSGVTEAAKEAKALAGEGFPWQASIGVRPNKIKSLQKDEVHAVNGREVTGPAEIWLSSEVFETSFVPIGADSNTSIATFSRFCEKDVPDGGENKNLKEDLEMELTIEKMESDHPDLLKEMFGKRRRCRVKPDSRTCKDSFRGRW